VSRLADWCGSPALEPNHELRRAEGAHRDPQKEPALEKAVSGAPSERWSQALRSMLQTGQAQSFDRFAMRAWFEDAQDDLLDGVDRGSVMLAPLLGRGVVLGTITFVSTDADRDYTDDDLVLAEELGRRAAIALDNARLYREAQEANRAKADFLAIISHELRTPLNAIMGYSDLLDAEVNGDLSVRQRKQVDRVRASARHLLQLIEEILSYARMETGGEELRVEGADAREIAREAAAVIEPMAESRSLEFRFESHGPPLRLLTDAGKVRQVLVNLLSNAVKFTERGHVELKVGIEGNDVVFEVKDTGIGIPESDIPRVFDPFWQVERPNTRRVGGTGLGLSVSRRYVRMLQGRLDIRSAPGRGTTVFVRIPHSIGQSG
jgi:signal transduction histidine kinase